MKMETRAVYVFIMAVPAEAPEKEIDRQDWENTNEILKNMDYISDWIEGKLFRLHYEYFYNFNQVIIELGKLVEENLSVKIIPANVHSECKLFLQIGNRRGYVHDTRSGFAFMLHQKTENSEAI
jgi:hypothetical protein